MLKKILKYILYAAIFTPLIKFSDTVFPYVFAKAVFFQIIVSIALCLYLVLLVRGEIGWPRRSKIFWVGAIFLGVVTVTSIFGVDFSHSFWDTQERMTGIFNLLYYVAFLGMLLSVIETKEDRQHLLLVLWVMGVLLMLSGYVQVIDSNFWGYEARSRIAGLLNNPIFYAIAMVFQVFLSLLLLAESSGWPKKIVYGLGAVAAFYAIFLSQTRGSVIGVLAGLLIFGLGEVLVFKDRKKKMQILTLLAIAMVSIFVLWLNRNTPFVAKLPISYYLDISPFANTGATRLIAWKAAYKGFLERPIFGWGLNNFNIIFNKFYDPESLRYTAYETWFDRTHNVTLEFLSTTGVVGFVSYAALFIMAWWLLIKTIRRGDAPRPLLLLLSALAAYLIQNQFALDQPTSLLLFFASLALVSMYTEPANKITVPGVPRGHLIVVAIAAMAATVVAVYQFNIIPLYAGYLDVIGSATSLINYDYSTTELKKALAINHPYRIDSVLEFTQAAAKASIAGKITNEQRTADFTRAEAEMKQVIHDHPQNTYYYYLLGRLYAEWGRYDARYFTLAEETFKQAEQFSPLRQQIFFGLGEMYLFAKQYDKSAAVFRHIVDLEPRVGEAHWYLALALYKLDQLKETFAELELAYQYRYVPQTQDELNFYVQLFEQQKRYEDIALIYERYIGDMEPANGDLYAKEAAAWLAAGNYDRAREAVATAVKLDSTLKDEAAVFSKMIDAAEAKH